MNILLQSLVLLVMLCIGLSGGFLAGLYTADRFMRGTIQLLEEWKAFATYIAQHGSVEGSYGFYHKDGDVYSAAGIRDRKFHPLIRMRTYPPEISMAAELTVRHSSYRDRPAPGDPIEKH